nr:tortifolia1-like protein 3 isoform X1 [Tanacetum cinerariifolium]
MSSTRDFKQKLLTCLTKLSDRDTHTSAATELERIAQNLTTENISAFISSITVTNSSDRSPVRKQCIKLISTVASTHGDILTMSLEGKLINAVIRRLRDNDTSVRSACVAAVFSIATHANKPCKTVCKLLVEALVTEQEANAQAGAAMCLAAAVEGAKEVDVVYLRRMLVRVEKLLKGDSFKAKSALLTVLGSLIGVKGVVCEGHVNVKDLVFVLVEYVKTSEEWSVRKSAAECLEKLAVVEGEMLTEYKASCLKTFEAKKFDKVKTVRETMIQMIEAWKAIPDVAEEEVLTPRESQASSKAEVASDGRFPPRTQITSRKTVPNRSPTTNAMRRTLMENRTTKTGPAMFRKLDRKKPNDQKVGTATPRHGSPLSVDNDDHTKNRFARPETKRALFKEIVDEEEVDKSEIQNARLSSTVVGSNITEDIHKSHRDAEELSLIRNQLIQIETQQSNLVDLLQKFIGSSQTGMQSLETRVHGLELTLDEISFDLARSTGRLSHPGPTKTVCCKLPGADFLTSKLWKKTEVHHSSIKVSSAPFATTSHMTGKNMSFESCNPETRGFRRQGVGSGLIKNPLAEVHRNAHGISEI